MNHTCEKCGTNVINTHRISLDLWLYVDATGSNLCPEGGEHLVSRVMAPYVFVNGGPNTYEDDNINLNLDTCRIWALHLRIPQDVSKEEILHRVGHSPYVTGEYLDEVDSWTEWGEPQGEDDGHLVIYFQSLPQFAARRGEHLAILAVGQALQPADFAISTSGDFAEQFKEAVS